MHSERISPGNCRGVPLDATARERAARWVVALTCGMMLVELVAGYATRSMALTADGWHMATHAGALGISAWAYWFARTRHHSPAFSFGTGKVHALAGYTSALILVLVAVSMLAESVWRLFRPVDIRFSEALPVAIVGLVVNLVSIKLLDHHDDEDHEDHDHPAHDHPHHDENHRAAYLHVVADALTSVLAIAALVVGRQLGWTFLDAVAGLLGGVLVLRWGVGLCRSAGAKLLDATASAALEADIRQTLEAVDDVRVADLHVWETGPGCPHCVVGLVTSTPRETAFYRELILARVPIAHLTVEVQRCTEGHD